MKEGKKKYEKFVRGEKNTQEKVIKGETRVGGIDDDDEQKHIKKRFKKIFHCIVYTYLKFIRKYFPFKEKKEKKK